MFTNISNHPRVAEIKRKAQVTVFTDFRKIKEIEIICEVCHFNSNDEPIDSDIAPRIVSLRATMQNCVDVEGNYLENCTPNGVDSFPEYAYWKDVITSGTINEDLIYQTVIQKADQREVFN